MVTSKLEEYLTRIRPIILAKPTSSLTLSLILNQSSRSKELEIVYDRLEYIRGVTKRLRDRIFTLKELLATQPEINYFLQLRVINDTVESVLDQYQQWQSTDTNKPLSLDVRYWVVTKGIPKTKKLIPDFYLINGELINTRAVKGKPNDSDCIGIDSSRVWYYSVKTEKISGAPVVDGIYDRNNEVFLDYSIDGNKKICILEHEELTVLYSSFFGGSELLVYNQQELLWRRRYSVYPIEVLSTRSHLCVKKPEEIEYMNRNGDTLYTLKCNKELFRLSYSSELDSFYTISMDTLTFYDYEMKRVAEAPMEKLCKVSNGLVKFE
jgi:hypothetical protein